MRRILDSQAQTLHQRIPVILGSRNEVRRFIDFHLLESAAKKPNLLMSRSIRGRAATQAAHTNSRQISGRVTFNPAGEVLA